MKPGWSKFMQKKTNFLLLTFLLILTVACGQAPQNNGDAGLIGGGIVGGEEVKSFNQFPFIVALDKRNADEASEEKELLGYCGGTLISKNWVLTAGHCLAITPTHITTGSTSKSQFTAKVKILEIVKHPSYGTSTVGLPLNDVALLRIEDNEVISELDFTQISIASDTEDDVLVPGTMATVMGWGAKCESFFCQALTPDSLRAVEVPIVEDEAAMAETSYGEYFKEGLMLAAGFERGGKDSCQGDSGGPLFVNNGVKNVLIGVVSAGAGCARESYYGLYARVTTYVEWIETTVTK
jgi:trypsin